MATEFGKFNVALVCPILQKMSATDEFPGKVKEYECLYRIASYLYDVLANLGHLLHLPALPHDVCKNMAISAQGVTECIAMLFERIVEV